MLLVLGSLPAYAQRYEFGLHAGMSLYTKRTVESAPSGLGRIRSGEAGFKTGAGFGLTLGHNMYRHIGGEVRYSMLLNDMKLEAAGGSVAFGSQAHAISYDLLVHFQPFGAKVRPYASFGGGLKYFRGTGTETAFQPLIEYAVLTRTSEIRPMASFGGGVKIALGRKMQFRIDVHDYFTAIPTKLIAPVPGASLGGWMHNIVPSGGIGFTF